jgi:DNA-binding CsgD family transcriptional regulator
VALGLSRREAEVLRWIVYGRSNVEIALILDIAVPTVKKHVERIFTKLGVENRQAAAARAREIAAFGAAR